MILPRQLHVQLDLLCGYFFGRDSGGTNPDTR